MAITSDRPQTTPPDPEQRLDAAAPGSVPATVHTVRRIDAWTVLRVSLVFWLCVLLVMVLSGIILWSVASAAGVIDNVEKFVAELFALEVFEFRPGVMLRSLLLGGTVLAVVASGANVVLAVLYNLIAELTGGIEISLADGPAPQEPSSKRRRRSKI